MTHAIYNENDRYACDWLDNLVRDGLITPGRVDRRSILELTAAELMGPGQRHFFAGIGGWSYALRLAGVPDDAPVWTGSCPCQPFSDAGKRSGTSDARHLWPAWFALIEQCRPPVIFGEQVASQDGLAWLDSVYADLERCNYSVGTADISAAGVGAPHKRQRLYFVALANDDQRGRKILGAARLHDHWQPRHDTTGRRASRARDLGNAAGERRASVDEPLEQGARRSGAAGTVPLADAEGARRSAQRIGEARGRSAIEPDRQGPAGGRNLGDSSGHGAAEHPGELPGDEGQHEERAAHGDHAPVPAGATRGFWAGAQWLPCIDGVSRPVEPGSFPLAHGVSGRMVVRRTREQREPAQGEVEEHWYNRAGALRGFGNAIVSEQAAVFIEAARDAAQEEGQAWAQS